MIRLSKYSNCSLSPLLATLPSFLLALSLLFSLSFSLTACNIEDKLSNAIDGKTTEKPPQKKADAVILQAEIDKTLNEIKSEIGNASCDNDKQCGAIPIGHKACGGPANFLAYSTNVSNTTLLLELSNTHQQLSRQLNQLKGMMSDCSVVTEPKVSCSNSVCEKILSNTTPIL